MTRTPLIAGNWKMNGDIPWTRELCTHLAKRSANWPALGGLRAEVAIFPPAVSLAAAAAALQGFPILLGAQNMHEAPSGAFTGEVSGPMLLTAGCQMVILGHSERRQFFGETDAGINRKALAALAVGLKPIVCVGESLDERESGRTHEVVERQLAGGLKGLTVADLKHVVIAYEPVWAIGTGKVATVQQAGDVHRFIRGWISKAHSPEAASRIRILYGGSVKADNAKELLADPDIDGALVGGASLDADQFDRIIRSVPLVS
ncbi:MAG: triose-phosphate isomerase [candidate division Zixibacteria bacterium]|nr:triose-phosphate isomerase [candidate division Zixibacteria bacterium]